MLLRKNERTSPVKGYKVTLMAFYFFKGPPVLIGSVREGPEPVFGVYLTWSSSQCTPLLPVTSGHTESGCDCHQVNEFRK